MGSGNKDLWQPHAMTQRSLFATDIKLYIVFCLGDVPLTHKQYITNTSLEINYGDLNYEGVVD